MSTTFFTVGCASQNTNPPYNCAPYNPYPYPYAQQPYAPQAYPQPINPSAAAVGTPIPPNGYPAGTLPPGYPQTPAYYGNPAGNAPAPFIGR